MTQIDSSKLGSIHQSLALFIKAWLYCSFGTGDTVAFHFVFKLKALNDQHINTTKEVFADAFKKLMKHEHSWYFHCLPVRYTKDGIYIQHLTTHNLLAIR